MTDESGRRDDGQAGSARPRWLVAAVATIGIVGALVWLAARDGDGLVVSTEPSPSLVPPSTVAEPATTSPTTDQPDPRSAFGSIR